MKDESLQRPVTAYLALGSNQGDRLALLREGRRALDGTAGLRVIRSSPLYETEPVGGPEGQETYFNAVLEVATTLEPEALLRLCLDVESRYGRHREERWGPRTLDIDLLVHGPEIRSSRELLLPHPRLHLRRFVLVPLADLAPALIHPRLGRSVVDLLGDLPEKEGVCLILETW